MSFWERWVGVVERRTGWVWGVVLALTFVSLASASRLRIDTRTESLLPDETPSLAALALLRERVGAEAPLEIVITSDDPALNRALAGRVRDEFATWPETRWAIDRRDPSVWLDHRLLYLPAPVLGELADRLDDVVAFEECEAMPGCVNFDDRPAFPTEAEVAEKLQEVPELRALARLFGAPLDAPTGPESSGSESTGQVLTGDAPSTLGSLCEADGSVCAVQASLDVDASDLDRAAEVLARAEAVLASVRPSDAPASLRMAVSGRFRNGPMTRTSVEADLRATTYLSLALLGCLLALQFRRARALGLLLMPLVVGLSLAFGVLGAFHPQLNLISAFTLAILSGLGIDFGIHLLTHYGTLRREGLLPASALVGALEHLGGSLVAAGLTTGCAFAALMAADFRGFSEMGWMAALGVGICLVSFLLLFPAAVLLAHRLWPEKGPWLRGDAAPSSSGPRAPRRIFVLGVVVATVGVVLAPRVEMEKDLRRLRSENVSHGIRTRGAIHGTTGAVVHLLADNRASLERVAAALRGAPELQRDGKGALVVTPDVLVPPDGAARLEVIARLRETTERLRARAPDDSRLARLTPWLEVDRPLELEDLPPWASELLRERDGTAGRLGLVFVPLRGSDARAMEELSLWLEGWRRAHPEVTFASPEAVLGEIVPGLREDAPRMLLLALAGLVLAVLVLGRSWRRTVLVSFPVAVAMLGAISLMVLFDLHLNLYNLLVLPVAFGVGVDGAIYVVWALEEGPAEERWVRFRTCARAVLGSTLTTLAAFGSIAVADHPGLASLGHLALATIALSLLANLVWLPALYAVVLQRGATRGRPMTVAHDASASPSSRP
ncbi:MAG: efflux RND transporter permease subunit [Polyangiales bacterium]